MNLGDVECNCRVPHHPVDGVLVLNLRDAADVPSLPHHVVNEIQQVLEQFALRLELRGI